MSEVLTFIVGVWAIVASLAHLRMKERYRDLLTDMTQQIHDGRVRSEHLRRARGHDAIEDYLERYD